MKHLLILQLCIINLVGAAGLVWGWPYVRTVFLTDTSGISYAIVALWAFGLTCVAFRAVKVSRLLDEVKVMNYQTFIRLNQRSRKLDAKNQHLSSIAGWCALLGMFGTVVGLIAMAISLKDNLGGVENLGAAIAQAFEGYGVALATTAVGIVAGGWLEVNALFIDTASKCVAADLSK